MLNILIASLALGAAEPGMEPLLENALQVDTGEMTYVVYFEEDGSYTTSLGTTGGWALVSGELCVTSEAGDSNCQPMAEDVSLGDTWQGENAAGDPVTLTIVERD
jgi:hypothetical protein